MFCAQITHDDVGFPQNPAVILNHRHLCVRVFAQVVGFPDQTKLAARVGALKFQTQLLCGPDDFTDIDGTGAAPDMQHGFSFCFVDKPLSLRA